jgi:hypothetical protein
LQVGVRGKNHVPTGVEDRSKDGGPEVAGVAATAASGAAAAAASMLLIATVGAATAEPVGGVAAAGVGGRLLYPVVGGAGM